MDCDAGAGGPAGHACESIFGSSRLFATPANDPWQLVCRTLKGFVTSTVLSYRFLQPQLWQEPNVSTGLTHLTSPFPSTPAEKQAAVLFL
jgi:hypothetical protein